MNMTTYPPNIGAADNNDRTPGPFCEVQLVRRGSPEHAAGIAARLGLPEQGPPPTPEQLAAQLAAKLARSRRFIRKRRSFPPQQPAPTCDRHGRKCAICTDKYRDEIEELFLDWRSPSVIAHEMDVNLRTLYRHAHATGLYDRRQGKLRVVLDRILEGVDRAHVSGDCILRAVRAYSCLGRDNKWTEPPTNVVFSSQRLLEAGNVMAPIEVNPAQAQLTGASRSPRKKSTRKPRVLIDTKTIRNRRNPLKTRGSR
jgi:hypothetical protein